MLGMPNSTKLGINKFTHDSYFKALYTRAQGHVLNEI